MAAKRADYLRIDIASLPDIAEAEMDFRDTSYFQSGHVSLPSPVSILQQFPDEGTRVVKFKHLNLAIKISESSYLKLEEAQTMRAIRQVFANNEVPVPVPEVFGWRQYGDQNFIYMSLIPGQTLREAWPTLTDTDKILIREDLSQIVKELRRLGQGSSGCFIGWYIALNMC